MWKTIDNSHKTGEQFLVIDMMADLPRAMPAFYSKLEAWDNEYHWFVGHPEDWEPNSFFTFAQVANVLGIIEPTHCQPMPVATPQMIAQYTLFECKGVA